MYNSESPTKLIPDTKVGEINFGNYLLKCCVIPYWGPGSSVLRVFLKESLTTIIELVYDEPKFKKIIDTPMYVKLPNGDVKECIDAIFLGHLEKLGKALQ